MSDDLMENKDQNPSFIRTEYLLGKVAMQILKKSTVAVFGIGGVGSFVVEALARSGVGHLVLIDPDTVARSNLNRQLPATLDTLGQAKVDVMKARIQKINPDLEVETFQLFFDETTKDLLIRQDYDYICDAIDTLTPKTELICTAKQLNLPIISCMSAGNKLDPTRFKVADIYQTSVCPISRILRASLKKRQISSLKVVYSDEPPLKKSAANAISAGLSEKKGSRIAPGSIAFVPSVAGLILAGEIIKDLIEL